MHCVSPIMLPIYYQVAICSKILRPFTTLSPSINNWHTTILDALVLILLKYQKKWQICTVQFIVVSDLSHTPFPLVYPIFTYQIFR